MRCFTISLEEKDNGEGRMPSLELYLLDGEARRPMVIVVPGGGYTMVCGDGERTAMQYSAAGFHTAVLYYSVAPACFPVPQLELATAIRTIREHAEEWRVQADLIAIWGSSAGGHLCASLSTIWNQERFFPAKEIRQELHKPNACILYSAVLTTRLEHCRQFLAGHVGSGHPENLEFAAPDRQVNPGTPPTFLYGTFEDRLANYENIFYYAEELGRNGIPFELHIFPRGGHGAPWCEEENWSKAPAGRDYRQMKLSVEWLTELFG